MRRLIVNADDYGLTPGVNRAIQQLAVAGCVTSATLMAGGGSAASAGKAPGLAVGCHVVLLDGTPVAAAADVATLLEPGTQNFYPTLGKFLRALYAGRIQPQHMQIEVAAQLNRLRDRGIQPTHVDTHKHTHMFPRVLRAVLAAAGQAGVHAIRNPFEPAWAAAATPQAGTLRRMQVATLRTLFADGFRKIAHGSGFVTTEGAIGVCATGSLDAAALERLLAAMPEGTWELVCHPGYVDAELAAVNTRLRESRETELSSLAKLPELLGSATRLIHFGELTS